jgi:signal peptidase I
VERARARYADPRRRRAHVALATVPILVLVGAFLALFTTYRVPSSSMEPTLRCEKPSPGCSAETSDRVLALDHPGTPHRGDLVVFRMPPRGTEQCGATGTFVKRLLGLPGEQVEMREGIVYADGLRVEEPYLTHVQREATGNGSANVPSGEYFVMGDNRGESCDSARGGRFRRRT